MRRKPGVAGIQKDRELRAKAGAVGAELQTASAEKAKEQLEVFRAKLQEFAAKHKTKIQQVPSFRQQFHAMCLATGVDPLSGGRSPWAEWLGLGNFTAELGVQVLTVCVSTRPD